MPEPIEGAGAAWMLPGDMEMPSEEMSIPAMPFETISYSSVTENVEPTSSPFVLAVFEPADPFMEES